MTLVDIVKNAAGRAMTDEDGKPLSLKLHPGLSEPEIQKLEGTLPAPLPNEIRELLRFCRGFDLSWLAVETVDFAGTDGFELLEVFPYGLPIADDGCGNSWMVDLLPHSTDWGPIYYACHDAPVILYQSPNLEHFLSELFKLGAPPHKSLVGEVHDDDLFDIWRKNPGVQEQTVCLTSSDPDIRAFAEQLDPTFQIIDMRDASIGFGFAWGRYGSDTLVKRFGTKRLFAYQKQPGFWARLFGRS
jgi:hypothetical protein